MVRILRACSTWSESGRDGQKSETFVPQSMRGNSEDVFAVYFLVVVSCSVLPKGREMSLCGHQAARYARPGLERLQRLTRQSMW